MAFDEHSEDDEPLKKPAVRCNDKIENVEEHPKLTKRNLEYLDAELSKTMTFGASDTTNFILPEGIEMTPDESEFVFELLKKVYYKVMTDLHGKLP